MNSDNENIFNILMEIEEDYVYKSPSKPESKDSKPESKDSQPESKDSKPESNKLEKDTIEMNENCVPKDISPSIPKEILKERFGYYKRENLKHPHFQEDHTELIQLYNPTLVIKPIVYNQKTYNIIRDDFLVGGTKQRGMVPYLESSKSREFVYAGPTTGYAQVALAYAAYLTGRQATLIVNRDKFMHPFTRKAYDYGAKVIPIPNGHLHKIQTKAEEYVKTRPYAEVVPFGGYTPDFVELMYKNIELALPDDVKQLIETKQGPKRMWLVGGSATLLNVLYKVFPYTEFMVIQIGKKIWDDQLDLNRTTKYIAAENFQEPAMIMPPYPSVSTYDAKLWIFATQYGKNGDYIWNVASD